MEYYTYNNGLMQAAGGGHLAKVIVCVDGFNLYYGAPKSTPYNQRNSLKTLHGARNRGGIPRLLVLSLCGSSQGRRAG